MSPAAHNTSVFIDTSSALDQALVRIGQSDRLALDLEADGLHHYQEQLSLIQIALDNGAIFLIDPLAEIELGGIKGVLEYKQLVIHDGAYDIRLLFKALGSLPEFTLFDTLQGARILGETNFGLGALVQAHTNIALEKANQKADWSRRPLPPDMLEYAANDVRYLLRIADDQTDQLDQHDRLVWHQQSSADVKNSALANEPEREKRGWRKLKGAGKIKLHEIKFVEAVWHWRDKRASERDVPPYRIMSNELVLALGVWTANNPGLSLQHGPRLPRNLKGNRLVVLTKVLKNAANQPDPTDDGRKKHIRPERNYKLEQQISKIRVMGATIADEAGLDPSFFAPKNRIIAIVQNLPKSMDDIIDGGYLLPWQIELLRPAFEKVLFGE
ncbi:ribonuclease D [Candidatus Neomarinimicrobiota bacterium]